MGPYQDVNQITNNLSEINVPSSPNTGQVNKGINNQGTPLNGYHRYQSEGILRDYFKDRDTFNFRYGLEHGLASNLSSTSTGNALNNLDEDPTIFGFDMVILNGSPLFNELSTFLDFADNNNIVDVASRRENYNDFINQFAKFFNVDDRNRGIFKEDNNFNSFKTHYLHGISGLDKLIHHTGMGYEGGRQMVDFGKDKLTFSLAEDITINAGYLSALYRTLIYSKRNGRMLFPENLLRFDMAIIVSEIRNFNRVSNVVAKADKDSSELIPVLNDNVSRYIFTLYDCQFNFNKYSFKNDIKQGGESIDGLSEGLTFDVYYKYVETEMEKFNFNPDMNSDQQKYINDTKLMPTSYQQNPDPESDTNKLTNAQSVDRFPNRAIDSRFRRNTKTNSSEIRSYEFDFPMMNRQYVLQDISTRNENIDILQGQSPLRRGINNIIDFTNERLQQRFIQTRSQLVSGLAVKVRSLTGLRNIPAPTNVYEGTGIGQFALDRIKDFANLGVGQALASGAGYLNKLAQGVEESIFDYANKTARNLKGVKGQQSSTDDILGDRDIPNVYR